MVDMASIDIVAPEAPAAKARVLPPHNGFGSFEDSAQNCTSLIPQPPKKNFYSLMQVTHFILVLGRCGSLTAVHQIIIFERL